MANAFKIYIDSIGNGLIFSKFKQTKLFKNKSFSSL